MTPWPTRVVYCGAALGSVAIGFVPGFAGPGYEVALPTGLLLPSSCAFLALRDTASSEGPSADAIVSAVRHSLVLGAIVTGSALLHGLRAGFCDPLGGLALMALGPLFGTLMGGAWGASFGLVVRALGRDPPSSLRTLLYAVSAPFVAIAVSIARFWTSPMVHAYDPFVGYFSGTIYDTVLRLDGLYSYRIGSACTLAGFCIAVASLSHSPRGFELRRPHGALGLVLAAAFLVGSLAHSSVGPRLGHWQTRETIAESLGSRVRGKRCEIVHARSISLESAARMLEDCDAHLEQVEAWLEVRGPETITVFAFEDESQKARLMGASGTNIAKPWRSEIYLHDDRFPNAVLGHELAHVVAASIGRGPFRVAGSLGGMLPNPGLIEGLAVAASPKEDELTAQEWSRAMQALGLLPDLDRLFALGFLGENSSIAYTVSGAFVGWIHDRYGAKVVSDWYGGAELDRLLGTTWSDLERQWHAALAMIDLPPGALDLARSRFDRPGFFRRRCPHVVDECRELADEALARAEPLVAAEALERARAFEPRNPTIALELADAFELSGRADDSRSVVEELLSFEELHPAARDRALTFLADLDAIDGRLDEASVAYARILARTFDDTRARSLELRTATLVDDSLRPVVLSLRGSQTVAPRQKRMVAVAKLAELTEARPGDAVSAYLLGRLLFEAEAFDAARTYLELALARGIGGERMRAEAFRALVTASCALSDSITASHWLDEAVVDGSMRPARIDHLRRLVNRCTRRRD